MKLFVACNKCNRINKVSSDKLPSRFSCKQCGKKIVLVAGDSGVEVSGGAIKSPNEIGLSGRLGKFHDLKLLAIGGMGDIYLAKLGGAEGFEKKVVLKFLHPHLARNENFAKAMVDEAKLTVLLQHPNIVQIHNLEKSGDLLYCVMEYVPGKSLAVVQEVYHMKKKIIPIPMAVYILIQALDGLSYAHEETDNEGKPLGIIHRDISPSNIMVTRDGWVKIIDFGIAKAATHITQTSPGVIKGKFAYMSPEQFRGKYDHRADLFAMGVILWEMLAGARLFSGDTDAHTMKKIFSMDPPMINSARPGIPEKMNHIISKALAKNPNERYASAREFKADLLDFAAPATVEDLRAKVDIGMVCIGKDWEEEGLGAGLAPEVSGMGGFDTQTRPVDVVTSARARKRLNFRWLLLAGFLVVLVAGLAAGSWWLWPHPSSSDESAPDAGVLPVVPGGHTSVDAGVAVQQPADASTAAGTEDGKVADGGKTLARAKPPPRRSPRKKKLTTRIVQKMLYRHGAKLQNCADTHLSQDAMGKKIKLVISFTIASTGRVHLVKLTPKKLESTDFGRCLINRVRHLKFPRHRKESASFSLPLRFQIVKN